MTEDHIKRVSSWLFLSIILAAAPLAAWGENRFGDPSFPEVDPQRPHYQYWEPTVPVHPVEARLRGFDLNEKQRQAVRTIERKPAEDAVRKGAELRIAEMEPADMLDKGPTDMGAVEAKLRSIGSIGADIRLSEIKTNREAEALLTPEQQKKLSEIPQPPAEPKRTGWRGATRMPPPSTAPEDRRPED
jgi:Spy/CpxP family protein refolding chaperone